MMRSSRAANGEIATIHDAEYVVGICGWCWRSTTLILESSFTGAWVPLHVTCVIQMGAVRKRIATGWNITGRTLAERRYLRLVRVAIRNGGKDWGLLGRGENAL
jgi:hypothetical protein